MLKRRVPVARRLGGHGLLVAGLVVALSGAAAAQTPPAGCVASGATLTCTGSQVNGIDINNTSAPFYTTLNVNNLAADIAPGAGPGVKFTGPLNTDPVHIDVNTGPWQIVTNGAQGIYATATGDLDLTVAGSLETTGIGTTVDAIYVQGRDVSVVSTASILAHGRAQGMHVESTPAGGDVEIVSYGTITAGETGILAGGTSGTSVRIRSYGDIEVQSTSDSFGIWAESGAGGAIAIDSVGNIKSAYGGIRAGGSSAITINSFGEIRANQSAIIASTSSGSVLINSFGNITTSGAFRVPDPQNSETFFPLGAITGESDAAGTTINSYGDIFTAGDYAAGISAVSWGEADVVAHGHITTEGDGAVGIHAQGAAVSVTSDAVITTHGENAPGIYVDSTRISSPSTASVVSYGNITTTGESSDGIVAGGDPDSVLRAATVVSYGDIRATGVGSAGIFASASQSVEVTNYGFVTGGPCCGAVMLSSDGDALVHNYGTIAASTHAGFAIQAGAAGDVAVDNYGTVTGDVYLIGVDSAVLNNHPGALFNTGANLQLLDTFNQGTVINDGTIAPGGRGSVLTTYVAYATLVQSKTGVYAVDLDPRAAPRRRNDLIQLDAGAARLAGKVAVNVLGLPLTGAQSFLILSASGGVRANGLKVAASPALHAALLHPNAQDVVLGTSVDFDAAGLSGNQRTIAGGLNRAFLAGAGGTAPMLLGLLNVGSLGAYTDALDQLSPQIYSDAEVAALYSSLAFSNSLLSCKVNGTDTASIIREGQCLWAGASARFQNTRTTSEQIGADETAGLFTAGAQVALDGVWRLGVAGGFQSSTLQTATGATSDGSLGQGGIALKYNPGPLLLAATISGGGAKYDTRRVMSFGGFTGAAESDQTLGIFSGTARAAFVLGSPQLYAKPTLDLSVTQLQLGSFTETGSAAALAVEGGGQTVFAAAPSVELGTEFWLSDGTLIRPLIRLGGIFYSGNDLALTAGFAGLGPLNAAADGSSFTLTTDTDDAMGLVGAGLDVINGNDAVLRLSYDGQIGETTQIQAVGIKGSARF